MANYKVNVRKERCKGCHLCIHFCKFHVLESESEVNQHGYFSSKPAEKAECRGCGMCYLVCPDMAIEITKEGEESE